MPCEWCKYQEGKKCHDEAGCDFKTLKMEKNAIIERMKEEVQKIEKIRKETTSMSIEDAQVAYFTVIDLAKGMDIMAKVLQDEFGMKEDEVKEIVVSTRGARSNAVLQRMKAKRRRM